MCIVDLLILYYINYYFLLFSVNISSKKNVSYDGTFELEYYYIFILMYWFFI